MSLLTATPLPAMPVACLFQSRFEQLAAAAGAGSPGELVLQMAEECLRVLVGVSQVCCLLSCCGMGAGRAVADVYGECCLSLLHRRLLP